MTSIPYIKHHMLLLDRRRVEPGDKAHPYHLSVFFGIAIPTSAIILVTVIFFGDFQILGSKFHDLPTLHASHLQANNRYNDMHEYYNSYADCNSANDSNTCAWEHA